MLQSLYKLTETSILFSVPLSNGLCRVNNPLRAVRACKFLTSINQRDSKERLIDSLVRYISFHPEYIREWADYPLLCTVACINNLRCLDYGFNTRVIIEQVPHILRFVHDRSTISEVLSNCRSAAFDHYMRQLKEILPRDKYIDFLLFYSMKNKRRMIRNQTYLNELSKDQLTVFYEHAVLENGNMLINVPQKFMSYKMCEFALSQILGLAGYVPQHLFDAHLSKCAVEKDPYSITVIPPHLVTSELCELAVCIDPDILKLVPVISVNMAVSAIMHDFNAYVILKEDIAVNSDFLEEVRFNMQLCIKSIMNYNSKMGWIAIFNTNPRLSSFVSDVSVLMDILASVEIPKKAEVLDSINRALISVELCEFAFDQHYSCIKSIPQHLITERMYIQAIKRDPNMLQFVPPSVNICPHIYINSVFRCARSIQWVPKSQLTYSLCSSALLRTVSAIYFIPKRIKLDVVADVVYEKLEFSDYEYLHNLITISDGEVLEVIKCALNDKQWRVFLDHYPYLLKYVPKTCLDQKVCDKIALHDITLIRHMPSNYITSSMRTLLYQQFNKLLPYDCSPFNDSDSWSIDNNKPISYVLDIIYMASRGVTWQYE